MTRKLRLAQVYGGFFVLAFALSVVMLLTDNNLRTDFGRVQSGYFYHWYVVLATAIACIVGAGGLIVVASRAAIKAGVVGSGLLSLIFVGDVFTYSQVGFSSLGSFANYLFGVTDLGGDIRFLFDAVLAVYLAAFVFGLVVLVRSREEIAGQPGTLPTA